MTPVTPASLPYALVAIALPIFSIGPYTELMSNQRSRVRPAIPHRRRGPKPDRCRALELLASCRNGCTEAILLAHGFTVDQTAELVRAGLVTAHSQRVIVARRVIEIARVKITEAGRRALTDKPTQ
jgi:hypothetical protein